MKKILLFFRGIYNGGTEAESYTLMTMLKNKYELYYTYFDLDNSDKITLSKFNTIAKYLPITEKFEVDTILFCTQAVKELDIIKQNFTYKKSYFWYHYDSENQKNFLKEALEGACDGAIAVSNTSRNQLIKLPFMTDKIKEKIIVINNVIDTNRILSIADDEIEYDFTHSLNLVTVARIAPEKRLDRVISIAKELEKRNIDYIWLIIGKVNKLNCTDYEKSLQKEFEEHPNIIFIGEKDNPFKYMKKADYSLLLSDRETWGLVITESKIVNTPCVVTSFPAAIEQIEDGYNGLVLDMNNENYVNIVDRILSEKDKLKQNLKDFKYNNASLLDKWYNIL